MKLIRIGVTAVGVVKDDGDGRLVKVAFQELFQSVDVDGVKCCRSIRSEGHSNPDKVPIRLSHVYGNLHNKVVHNSVHEKARDIRRCRPDDRNFPCGKRNPVYEWICFSREIAIGTVQKHPVEIVL